MATANDATYVPPAWENYANAAADGADDFDGRTARRLIIGTGGSLYLIPVAGGSEQLFAAAVPSGAVVTQQCAGIGATTTATDITAQF